MIADANGKRVESPDIFRPKIEPPTILNATVNGRNIDIIFFGAVGATSYKLYKSSNPNNMSLFLDNIREETDVNLKDVFRGEIKCSSSIYYQMVSVREDLNLTSPPVNFTVTIMDPQNCKSQMISSTTSNSVLNTNNSLNIVLIIGVALASTILLSALVVTIFKTSKKKPLAMMSSKAHLIEMGKTSMIIFKYPNVNPKTLIDEISLPEAFILDFASDILCDIGEPSLERGQGSTAKVYKGKLASASLREKYGDVPIAVKLLTQDENHDYIQEAKIMMLLPQSPYLVSIIGYTENPRALIMKHYTISLRQLLKSPDCNESILIRLKIGFDIARGMQIIHRHGILHLDLKPRTFDIHYTQSIYMYLN